MNSSRKPYFIANWKMNHLRSDAVAFCKEFVPSLPTSAQHAGVGIAPAFTLLPEVSTGLAGSTVMLGAQNVHWLSNGAHTGEVSVAMLGDWGCRFVIVGHSERRQFYGETSECVSKRALAAIRGGILAVVCVGELEEDFRAKRTQQVVEEQLKASLADLTAEQTSQLIVAYEPIWAIGTGLAATPEIAQEVHQFIREVLQKQFGSHAESISVIYGGSATPENIRELCAKPDVDGALVGGASLKAESFSRLISAGLRAN